LEKKKMKTLNWQSIFALCSVVLLSTMMTATPQAYAAPPRVVCVPWYPQNLAVPHDTWSGKEITLKGTARDPDGDAELATYEWDFGDGSPTVSGGVTNPYVIEAKHTYIGNIGDSFVATLTVTDINGESDFDDYLIEIRDGSVLAVQVNMAIDEGLWRLHKDQDRGTYPDGADYGYWSYSEEDDIMIWTRDSGTPGDITGTWNHIYDEGTYDITFNPDGSIEVVGEIVVDCPGTYTASGTYTYDSSSSTLTVEFTSSNFVCEGPEIGIERFSVLSITSTDLTLRSIDEWAASATGACTEAFEIQGHFPTGNALEDPYVETVQWGLNYLLANTHAHDISIQGAGDPDTNGNGKGLGCYTDSGHSMYECGITLMTFASSKAPNLLAETGDATWVKGRTYKDIVQDMVDYLAFGQSDPATGNYRGGWRYHANYGESDNSCAQWPVIGMESAEVNFGAAGVIVPWFVKEELNLWIDYIQHDASGGSGYMDPGDWHNVARTGGLLCEMKFFGDDTTFPRVIDAVNFIDTRWDTDEEHFIGNSYYAFYSVMKGLRLLGIKYISPLNDPSGLDWYGDPVRGYATYLVNRQLGDGSWSEGYWSSHPLCSAWALLTLQETVVEPGPVADAGPDVANHPPLIEVRFDASGSYHLDPAKSIVQYEWDFDGDGTYDYSSSGPTAEHAYPAVYNPDGTINWPATTKDYTVTLRVTDDSVPAKHDTDECIVHITEPPWPPVADAGGPYLAGECETITLDGSGSYDPDGEFYPDPAHPWHGFLVSWEWDLDNDGQYDDATGETVEWSSCVKGLYVIGLKVTDNTGLSDAEDTVINVGNGPPVADADGPYNCAAGEITFDGCDSTDPDPGETETLQYRWDFESDGIYDTAWSTDCTVTYTYPVCEEYTATLQVKDIDGATDTDTAEVSPNQAPDCSEAYAAPNCLWVPNHKMVSVSVLGVTDPDGDPVSITITGITSDEATASEEDAGGAKHAPDADGVGTDTAQLRAERSESGNGRVYEISFTASDGMGGECEGSVSLCVPQDQSEECECIDDGQNYDATQVN
jgi:hypothetical protein